MSLHARNTFRKCIYTIVRDIGTPWHIVCILPTLLSTYIYTSHDSNSSHSNPQPHFSSSFLSFCAGFQICRMGKKRRSRELNIAWWFIIYISKHYSSSFRHSYSAQRIWHDEEKYYFFFNIFIIWCQKRIKSDKLKSWTYLMFQERNAGWMNSLTNFRCKFFAKKKTRSKKREKIKRNELNSWRDSFLFFNHENNWREPRLSARPSSAYSIHPCSTFRIN